MKIARTSLTLGIALSDQGQVHGMTLEIFLHLPQYKLSGPISQLWNMLGSCDYQIIIYKIYQYRYA